MKIWRWVLLLLLVAAVAAFGWHWIAADPGYVLVRMRGWRVETSVVTLLVLLLLAWAVLVLLWRALRWPFAAMSRRHRRVGRKRLAQGLVAMFEGRHGDAERSLHKAARYSSLRGPALLAAAEAARQRGAPARALETLDQATHETPQAARVLRARALRDMDRADEAVQLLSAEADAGTLPPDGWRELVESALAAGLPIRARGALEPLRKSAALAPAAYQQTETRVLREALQAAPNVEALNGLWRGLSRAQRSNAVLIAAYARNAGDYGSDLAAMDEIEAALRQNWDRELVLAYGELDGNNPDARIRLAEKWLDKHADDSALLTTLGRMCAREHLWGKAREYLQRALAIDANNAGAWEALGDAASGENDPAAAAHYYRNASLVARGVAPNAMDGSTMIEAEVPSLEERTDQGLPRLPNA